MLSIRRPDERTGFLPSLEGISKLLVQGFKSLAGSEPYEIAVRPLTLMAGANSSGKSSAIQPLLLLKQTLEANFDPGPLLLDGPHVRFTSTQQILPSHRAAGDSGSLAVGLEIAEKAALTSYFEAKSENEIDLASMVYSTDGTEIEFAESLTHSQIKKRVPPSIEDLRKALEGELLERASRGRPSVRFKVLRRRCFFEVGFELPGQELTPEPFTSPAYPFSQHIREMIHVPGLRGNPERSYRTSAVGGMFPGTFEAYVASIIHQWKRKRSTKLRQLWSDLADLGLTWKVEPRQLDATQVEIKVGRLPHAQRGGARDLVNIADVGFGVSQTLPVVVALLTAEPGQLVYLEQPEIHLHPKAQVALADLLANAARRGVRVIAETHSALLVLAVQSLVAEQKLSPDSVILHWFQRDRDGRTQISSAELDRQGAYGDWPEDFGDVELGAQSRYMDAVEERLLKVVGG